MSAEPLDRRDRRLLLGVAALLPLADAAALLPMGDGAARRWLRERGLVRDLDGRAVVRWLDVLDALDPGALTAPSPARRHRRTRLDPL